MKGLSIFRTCGKSQSAGVEVGIDYHDVPAEEALAGHQVLQLGFRLPPLVGWRASERESYRSFDLLTLAES